MKKSLLIFLMAFAQCAYATENVVYYTTYKIKRVVDGDTVEIEAPFLPTILGDTLLLRLMGVDTPERYPHSECLKESKLADEALDFVEDKIKNAQKVEVILKKWDKYGGRVLGQIFIDGVPLTDELVEKGYGIEYRGEHKTHDWCK